jgi:hypothetical protein
MGATDGSCKTIYGAAAYCPNLRFFYGKESTITDGATKWGDMSRIPITHLLLGLATMLVVLASVAATDVTSSVQLEPAYDLTRSNMVAVDRSTGRGF